MLSWMAESEVSGQASGTLPIQRLPPTCIDRLKGVASHTPKKLFRLGSLLSKLAEVSTKIFMAEKPQPDSHRV